MLTDYQLFVIAGVLVVFSPSMFPVVSHDVPYTSCLSCCKFDNHQH